AADSVAAMTLGAALWPVYGPKSVLFPLFARACGMAACAAGVMTVRGSSAVETDRRVDAGLGAAAGAATAGLFLGCFFLFDGDMWLFSAAALGLVSAGLYVFHSRYQSAYRAMFPPLSEAGDLSAGLAGAAAPAVLTAFAVLGSYYCGVRGLERHIFGGTLGEPACGLFGIGMAVTGALSISGYVLALGGFGDIARRVRDLYEATPQTESYRKESEEFSETGQLGSDTASGYAGAASLLASAALLAAYIGESARILRSGAGFPWIESISVATAGAALPYVFGALYLGGRARDGGGRGALPASILAALPPALVLPAAALVFKGSGHGPEAVSAILLSGIAGGWLFSAFIGKAAGARRMSPPYGTAGASERALLMELPPLLNAFLRLLPAMALALAPLFARG
ncbi:MAG TPA: sodium/proton-translocating pyrophosphatase, partial [Elusimicrobiales bacterium]|nr:sodium/proton-translocating pyrophosphatase [Elusimicrobiales bacterium]